MDKAHLLIVDDSITQLAIFARNFRAAGYKISLAPDGLEAIQKITEIRPDLVLIDYEMPKLTGMDVIEWIRGRGLEIPVILMTCRDSDELHMQCLNLGSDDYLRLPVAFPIMLAHVELRLRKHAAFSGNQEKVRFMDIEVNTRSRNVYRGPHLLDLTDTEYRLLLSFLRHPLQVLSRDQILEQAWETKLEVDSQIVATYVKTLRRKLEMYGGDRLIHNVHGVGYILRPSQNGQNQRDLVTAESGG